jgi:hypothetical protein
MDPAKRCPFWEAIKHRGDRKCIQRSNMAGGRAMKIMFAGSIVLLGSVLSVPAFAQGAPNASNNGTTNVQPGSPDVVVCTPAAGTIISTTATSNRTAWMPTNVSSSELAGKGTATLNESTESDVSESQSAAFTISASFLFASASTNYGIMVGSSSDHTSGWSYSIDVPLGMTAKIQQYKEAADLGIKSVQEVQQSQTACGPMTSTSTGGNFYPYKSTTSDTFCYALVSSVPNRTAAIQVNSGCVPND